MTFWSAALRTWPFLRLEGRHLVIVVVLAIHAVIYLFSVPDPDYYWHLRTGQYILESGALPTRDVFSYTAGDRPWVLHEWAAQILLAALEGRSGFAGVVFFFSLLSTVAFFLEYRLLRQLGVHPRLAAVLTFASDIILLPFVSVRPLIFTWVFLTAYLLVLYPYHRGQSAQLWLLPLLMVPWVNLHGGFVIGITVLALLIAVRLAERLLWRRSYALRPLLLALLATVAATFANPGGLQGVLYPLSYFGGDNASREFIAEWQSPDFHVLSWMLLLGLPVLGGVALGLARTSLGLWPYALFALTATMALQSTRFIPIFGLVAIPALGEALRDRMTWARTVALRSETPRGYLMNWAVLVTLATLALMIVPRLPFFHLGGDPFRGKSTYPEQGAAVIAACYPQARMFNLYGWGGYLIWRLYPDQRVFIDGRADLHGARMLQDYAAISRLRPGWRELLDSHGIDLVIFEKQAILSVALGLDPGWQRVFEGTVETIYVRGEMARSAALQAPGCATVVAKVSG